MSDSKAVPVIRISYQSSLGESRGAVFETYVPIDSSIGAMTAIMDKLRLVCDHQTAIAKITELSDRIVSEKATAEALSAELVRVREAQIAKWNDSGRKGEFKLSASEVQHHDNMQASIAGRLKSVELLEKELARYEAIIAKSK